MAATKWILDVYIGDWCSRKPPGKIVIKALGIKYPAGATRRCPGATIKLFYVVQPTFFSSIQTTVFFLPV